TERGADRRVEPEASADATCGFVNRRKRSQEQRCAARLCGLADSGRRDRACAQFLSHSTSQAVRWSMVNPSAAENRPAAWSGQSEMVAPNTSAPKKTLAAAKAASARNDLCLFFIAPLLPVALTGQPVN